MGEKIRDLGSLKIGLNSFNIELNKGTNSMGDYDIHIQNEHVRLNISEYDFCKMAAALIHADEKVNEYKRRYKQGSVK